jgi:hypothetical protein
LRLRFSNRYVHLRQRGNTRPGTSTRSYPDAPSHAFSQTKAQAY